jgi:hypothetical protein
MDDSFEDPGTFDEDGYDDEEGIDGEAQLDARPAPDLNGLLSVSPLVRFGHRLVLCSPFVLCSHAGSVAEPARQGKKRGAVPRARYYRSSYLEPF